MKEEKITQEMAELCYETAKSIFPDKDKISETAREINKETNMNLGSARIYIKNFFSMLDGEKLSQDMSERDCHYYFERIQKEFGNEILKKAILSLQLYLVDDKQSHPSLQKLINEFNEKIEK